MTKHTFTRELRLLTPSQFTRIFNDPIKAASPLFTVLAKPNNLEHPRIGLTVAKKRVKKAVDRNTVKRVIRDSFRLNQHNLPPIDIVIMVKSGIDQQPNAELFKQLEKLWRKIAQRSNLV